MSREDSVPPLTPRSHTSTNQWHSFEMRMRLRRAERCVLRAEVALEAGFPEEARTALEEARRLDSARNFDALEAQIAERLQRPARRTAPPVWAAMLVTAALVAAVAVFVAWRDSPATVPETTAPTSDSIVATSAVPEPPVPPSRSAPSASTIVETEFVRPEVDRVPGGGVAPRPTAGAPAVTPARLGGAPLTTGALPLPIAELPPEAPVPSTPEPKEAPGSSVAPSAEPVALPAASLPPAVADTASTDERPRVRAALSRYETGYTSLNVDAVRAVWPGVDARSLTRAFEGLASQRVSLGQCSIAVAANTARADCRGQANWAPRIGGGHQTANRTWTFDLRNVAGAWQIVRVQTR